ncbi:MAG: sodium:proton antiporter [Campylobacteraceae bacterium]|jgi:putative phosphoribosyl transferase|nr:sodium:proton antiporter [Campylobacteraceae bacterium]
MSEGYMFASYEEAAAALLEILPVHQMEDEDWILMALSLASVPMANFISNNTGLSFDIMFSEPLFAPNNPECIIGVVSESEEIVTQNALIDSFGIKLDYIYGEAKRKYEESILKKIYKYRKGASLAELKGRGVLLLDIGCESGMRALASMKTAISEKAKSASFAVPVIAQNTAAMLESEVDGLFCLSRIANFVNTDFYYKSKEEDLNCEEILDILKSNKHYISFQKSQGDE